jgi:hypothetical protein
MSTKKPNYAERYMQHTAVRNAFIEILTQWFGGKDGPGVIAEVADELLAVNPKDAYKRFMEGTRS